MFMVGKHKNVEKREKSGRDIVENQNRECSSDDDYGSSQTTHKNGLKQKV